MAGIKTKNNKLKDRVEELEAVINSSNLHSTNFWSRALAVLGHYWAVYGVILIGFFILGFFAGIMSSV